MTNNKKQTHLISTAMFTFGALSACVVFGSVAVAVDVCNVGSFLTYLIMYAYRDPKMYCCSLEGFDFLFLVDSCGRCLMVRLLLMSDIIRSKFWATSASSRTFQQL